MAKIFKTEVQVWDGSEWTPVYRAANNQNALLNLSIKDKLGSPVMARFSLINRPATTGAKRGYVESTYGAYLEEFDRIRLVDTKSKAIIFYGRVYRQETKQDSQYGSLLHITAFDALQELAENNLQGDAANLSSETRVSDAIAKLINNFTYNTGSGSGIISGNISVSDTQKFNTSASQTAEYPNFSEGNETALGAIYKLAAKDPHSSSTSNSNPDSDFGYNYFVDSGFTTALKTAPHSSNKPAFNYFKRETIPDLSPDLFYNISYKGTAADGDSTNSYTTTVNTFSELNFSKQYTDIVTDAVVTYSKTDGTAATIHVQKLNVVGITGNGASSDFDFSNLFNDSGVPVSIQRSPRLFIRENTSPNDYIAIGSLIYLDNPTNGSSAVALVTLEDRTADSILYSNLIGAGGYDGYLYASKNLTLSNATLPSDLDRFRVDSASSSVTEIIREKAFNYDSVEAPDDVRRAIAAHFTKKTETTTPIRASVAIAEYPFARITDDPSSISTNTLTTNIDFEARGVRKGMVVRQLNSAGAETGNYGYISNVTSSTITVQLYNPTNNTPVSWNSTDKFVVYIPIRPGFKTYVENDYANVDGPAILLDVDYSEGVGVQTAQLGLVINNLAAIYGDAPNMPTAGSSNSPLPDTAIMQSIAKVDCDFTNTGGTQVNWASGTLYIGSDEYTIASGNASGLSTTLWKIVYWLPAQSGGNDNAFSVASSVDTVPPKAVKIAKVKGGPTVAQWEFLISSTDNPQYDLGDSNVIKGVATGSLFSEGNRPFTTNLEIRRASANTVIWDNGTASTDATLTFSSGDALTIPDGTSATLSDGTYYVYIQNVDLDISSTYSLVFSQLYTDAIGDNVILLAVLEVDSAEPSSPAINQFNAKVPTISAVNIAADSITADKLEASLVLSTTVIAGTSGGARVELDASGAKIIHAPGSLSGEFVFEDTSSNTHGLIKAGEYTDSQSGSPTTKDTLSFYAPSAASASSGVGSNINQVLIIGKEIGESLDAEFMVLGSVELKGQGEPDDPPDIFWSDNSNVLQGSILVNGGVLYVKNGSGTVTWSSSGGGSSTFTYNFEAGGTINEGDLVYISSGGATPQIQAVSTDDQAALSIGTAGNAGAAGSPGDTITVNLFGPVRTGIAGSAVTAGNILKRSVVSAGRLQPYIVTLPDASSSTTKRSSDNAYMEFDGSTGNVLRTESYTASDTDLFRSNSTSSNSVSSTAHSHSGTASVSASGAAGPFASGTHTHGSGNITTNIAAFGGATNSTSAASTNHTHFVNNIGTNTLGPNSNENLIAASGHTHSVNLSTSGNTDSPGTSGTNAASIGHTHSVNVSASATAISSVSLHTHTHDMSLAHEHYFHIGDKIGIALEDQSTTGNTFDFVALKM